MLRNDKVNSKEDELVDEPKFIDYLLGGFLKLDTFLEFDLSTKRNKIW